LEIEPTLLCNAACLFCACSGDIKKFKKQRQTGTHIESDLFLQKILRVLQDIQNTGIIKGTYWAGGGEPTIWPTLFRQ